MPESTLRWQSFNQKKPYFIATVFSLVAMAFAVGFLFKRLAEVKKSETAELEKEILPLTNKDNQFKRAYGDLKKAKTDLDQLNEWMTARYQWVDLLAEIRGALIRVEEVSQRKYGAPAGLWIEKLHSYDPLVAGPGDPSAAASPFAPPAAPMSAESEAQRAAFRARYGVDERGPRTPAPEATLAVETGPTDTNAVNVVFRGVSLDAVATGANKEMAFAVERELQQISLLNSNLTQLDPVITPDETNFTFTFSMKLSRKTKESEALAAAAAAGAPPAAPDPNAAPAPQ